jgi:hypothetical protein
MKMGYFMISSDKKLEYFDLAGVPVLIHLTEVRCFALAHNYLSLITEQKIPLIPLRKSCGSVNCQSRSI